MGFYLSILEFSGPTVARALTLLAEDSTAPAVAHCAAGKDRTGVFVALALSAVGVPDRVIARDYARTSPALPAVLTRLAAMPTYAADPNGLRPEANRTEPETMIGFLTGVRARYGSVPGYLARRGRGRGRPRRPTGLPGGRAAHSPACRALPSRAGAGQVAGAMPACRCRPGTSRSDDAAAACACR